jgi:CBS domain-containing protein
MEASMNASELCIREVITARADEPIVEAARRMARYNVGNLIVVEETDKIVRPIGIVTDRDLVVGVLARGDAASHQPIRDVMPSRLVTATEDTDTIDVLALMRQHAIRRIPIVNQRGGLEGVIALDDILGWIADQLGTAAALLQRQIGSASDFARRAM